MTFQKRRALNLIQESISNSEESVQEDSFLNIIDILEQMEEIACYEGIDEDFEDDLEEGEGSMGHGPFVKSCVSSVTAKGSDIGRAFAICQSQYKKGNKSSLDKKAASKGDYSSKMNKYEKALTKAKSLRKKKGG